MTNDFFHSQMGRLKTRFGKKAFDQQLEDLIASEVWAMSEDAFLKLVSWLIGAKPATRPPLLQDFVDARRAQEKKKFDDTVHGAAKAMAASWPEGSLRRALDANPAWRGCNSAYEAVQVEILRLRIEKADNAP